jgi:hypothetical protein
MGGKWGLTLSGSCPWAHYFLQLAVLIGPCSASAALGWPTVLQAELKAVGGALAKVSLVQVAGRLCGKNESGLQPNYPPVDFWKAALSGSRGAEVNFLTLMVGPTLSWRVACWAGGINVQMLLPRPYSASPYSGVCSVTSINSFSPQPVEPEALATIW